MKLRIRGNSVRLRLTRSEVNRLVTEGSVEETTVFSPEQRFTYAVETSKDAASVVAALSANRITVRIPAVAAADWALTNEVTIEHDQDGLTVLVEKDFVCVTARPEEDQADAFPHPTYEKC